MSLGHDPSRQDVYDAESLAFLGTPLADLQSEQSIIADYRTAVADAWWKWGSIEIRRARADMTRFGGLGGLDGVTTSAGRTHRSTVSHELAHVMAMRQGNRDHHGPHFRTAHLYTVGAIFGRQYADLLAQAYEDYVLPVFASPAMLDIPNTPTINIDALSIATAPRGGWSR